MLSKKSRLNKKKNFKDIFQRGKSFKENFLVLKVLKKNANQIRFGFVVSQLISKKATVRNKIKRRLSELVRPRFRKLKRGIEAVLIATPGIETKNFLEMEKILDKLFKKSGIQQR